MWISCRIAAISLMKPHLWPLFKVLRCYSFEDNSQYPEAIKTHTSSQLWFTVCKQAYFYISFSERMMQNLNELGESSLLLTHLKFFACIQKALPPGSHLLCSPFCAMYSKEQIYID